MNFTHMVFITILTFTLLGCGDGDSHTNAVKNIVSTNEDNVSTAVQGASTTISLEEENIVVVEEDTSNEVSGGSEENISTVVSTHVTEIDNNTETIVTNQIPEQIIVGLPEGKYLLETQENVRNRIKFDISKVKEAISLSKVENKIELIKKLNGLALESETLSHPVPLKRFRAIIPFENVIHKEIFEIYSKILYVITGKDLLVWHTSKHQKLDLYEVPHDNLSNLNINMMKNEYRYESINVTNSSGISKHIDLKVSGLAKNIGLEVFKGEFVDDRRIEPLLATMASYSPGGSRDSGGADALLKLQLPYAFDIPSGMTKQITFLVKSDRTTKTGDSVLSIEVKSNNKLIRTVNLGVSVSNVSFAGMDFSLHMYDYISEKLYTTTTENQKSMAETYTKHYGDTVTSRIPIPEKDNFSSNGTYLGGYDFSKLDNLLQIFPNAKNYFVFNSLTTGHSEFASFSTKNKAWDRAVGTWSKALSTHMISKGKNPSQLLLSVIEEPRTLERIEFGLKYAKAVKQYAPEIRIYGALYAKSAYAETKGHELINTLDVINIARHHFYGNTSEKNKLSEEAKSFYRNIQSKNEWKKELWFYGTIFSAVISSEDRLLHLTRDFYNHADGGGYWSLVDSADSLNSWNMYPRYRPTKLKSRYSPLYVDKYTVTTSRQWEAMREAMQNNGYIIMLRNKVKKLEEEGYTFTSVQKNQIDGLLNTVPKTALEVESNRLKALDTLELLNKDDNRNIYRLRVHNGKSSSRWNRVGDTVTIEAALPSKNHIFESWHSNGGASIADKTSKSTLVTIKNNEATVTASFKYVEN